MTYIGLRSNLPFPILNNDILMRQSTEHKPEIRFMEQPNGTTVCCYLISCDGTFDDMYSREARGIVFDKNGHVISRPLHKFFNLNQNEEVQFDKIDWAKTTRIMTKRDGSMISSVGIKNTTANWPDNYNFDLKSKKSFTSDVALCAKDFVAHHCNYGDFCNHMVANDKTAIFEWTSPTARIVLAYAQDELKLLHVRDNLTGEYMKGTVLGILAEEYNIPVVESMSELYDMFDTPEGVMRYIEETEGVEGVVVQFHNGDMIKIKTKWYMDRHHLMTFLRERDIAAMVLDESIDDQIAMLVSEGVDVSEIKAIEARVVKELDEIIEAVSWIHHDNKHLSRKDFAIKLGSQGEDHPYFGMLMRKYNGQEPDYKYYFEKCVLKEKFSLRQLNLLQSVAEEE